jgi:hypothetical protein
MSATDRSTDRTTDTATVTAAQRRHMFQELIGANAEKNHGLWWALDRVITSAQDERDDRNHEEVAVLARHFPNLERAIMAVWHHVTRTDDVSPCGLCEPPA